MKNQLRIQKKLFSQSASTSINNLQKHPFNIQKKSQQIQPSSSNQEQKLDSNTQYESNNLLEQNLANIPVNAPGTSAPPPVQTKLTIGQPGDKYEQEADLVASQVVSQINAPSSQQPVQSQNLQRDTLLGEKEEENSVINKKPLVNSIQRDEISEEEENSVINKKPLVNSIQRDEISEEEENSVINKKPLVNSIQRDETSEEEENPDNEIVSDEMPKEEMQMKPMVQRQSTGEETNVMPDLETSIQQSRGGGQGLADNVRGPMEDAFGADFSGVKVHTDSNSDQMNQQIQARAFTTGQDVFFRKGEYNPASQEGQTLIAHELTHVVQQNGSTVQNKEENSK